jgi:hypothetical protein
MGINITVDEKLMAEAERLTGESDRTKLTERVFQDFIKRKSPLQEMLDLVGEVKLRDDYDYKSMRAGDSDRD